MASRIKDLVEGFGGELSLHRAFVAWCRAVSEQVGLISSPQFAYGKSINAQAAVGVNTTLAIDGEGLVNGIPRSPGNSDAWVLTPGKVYALHSSGFFDTFSDPNAGLLRIEWVDDTNTPIVSGSTDIPGMLFCPATSTASRSTAAGAAPFIYRAPAADLQRVVKLRCTAATGNANKPASSWSVAIIEIPN